MKEATSLENVLVCLLEDNEISNTIGVRIEGVNRGMSVNESDLYSLILRSRKPEAEAFKKWMDNFNPTKKETPEIMEMKQFDFNGY